MLKKATSILQTISKVLLIYCQIGLAVIAWPISGWVLALVAVMYFKKRRARRLTTLGSARWADQDDLKSAGMLGATSGLILGRSPEKQSRIERLTGRNAWKEELIRLPQAVHTAVFAPTGVGKSVSLVIPFLLTSEESCVVTDFKCELAINTAEHRRTRFGHQIVLIDPYGSVTQNPSTYNPLDFIGRDHPLALDDCNDLANALVVRTGSEHEPHWNDMAETVIAAVTATVVAYGEIGTRSLQTVRDIISHPKRLEMAIRLMTESDRWGGSLAPLGGQLMQMAEKEKASVLSSALRHLRFLGTPAVAQSISTSSFDPSLLRKGRMTVYLILPPDRAHAQSGLLRMWVGSLLRACVREGMQ